MTQIFHDPNRKIALAFRERFPTPHAIATASLSALLELRVNHFPSQKQLVQLQQLAAQTIGTKDPDRQRSLVLEQALLIKELRLIQEQLEQLTTEISHIVTNCREGQILLSMPPIGSIQAAMIIATIGNIANFEKASEVKSYLAGHPG